MSLSNGTGDSIPHKDVALFLDFENVYISVRQVYNQNPNFEVIKEKAEEFGRVIISRAYADWYRYQRITNALYANGIEPVYVPTYYYGQQPQHANAIKNSVDIHMVIDAMRTLYTHDNIDTFVFVTGDRDFIPLMNAIRQHGKECIVVGVAEAASSHLAQSADAFFFYHQLSEDVSPAKVTQDPYEALAEAVKIARKRENEPTFATIKLIMQEIMGKFDQSQYKNRSGRNFTKFKDFVKEGERRGVVQLFASGTMNMVLLPGDKPQEVSKLAADVMEVVEETPTPKSRSDSDHPFDLVVDAIHLARRRNNLCTMATLKVLMKDIQPGFDESNYLDGDGKPYSKFKDLVQDAVTAGKVQLLTTGTVDEVFLPGEDLQKLSRFANRNKK
ncbi:MAG: NYN domain-containing protein [Anaerolineales bacterium]|nr:NYN domain-containing protein [Anaerolineales bacterium]MCB9127704.1 NYN domain-containing protein [Ardenticatenales bacterium]